MTNSTPAARKMATGLLATLVTSAMIGSVAVPLATASAAVPPSAQQASLAAFTSPSPAATSSTRQIAVLASLGGRPIVGGKITVRNRHGKKLSLVRPAKTTSRGGAIVSVRNSPQTFIVEVTGGKVAGKSIGRSVVLSAFGKLSEPAEYVNPVTTLAVRYAKKHRKASITTVHKRVAGFLGVPTPREGYFRLGQLGAVRSSTIDPALMLSVAKRHGGLSRYLDQLVSKAAKKSATKRFRPTSYRPSVYGQHRSLLGATDGKCADPEVCAVRQLATQIAAIAAKDVQSSVCNDTNGQSSEWSGLLGCGTSPIDQLAQVLQQMTVQLNDIASQVSAIQQELAQSALAAAWNQSQLAIAQSAVANWVADQQVLSATGVTVAPLVTLAPDTATIASVCQAAYPSQAVVSGSTQSPYSACVDSGNQNALFTASGDASSGPIFNTIFTALTGWDQDGVTGNLLLPAFEKAQAGNGTQLVTGAEQNSLNQLFASFVGLQATAFQNALSWQSFYATWTGGGATCPGVTPPTAYTPDTTPNIRYDTPCATSASAWYQLSVEQYIAANGARTDLPGAGSDPGVVIDTVGSLSSPNIWWAYAVDASAASRLSGKNSSYPYYPGYAGNYTGNDPLVSPASAATIATAVKDSFDFATASQASALVHDAQVQAGGSSTGNAALATAGFVGPGASNNGMNWSFLATSPGTYTFAVQGAYPHSESTGTLSCQNWPSFGAYSCTPIANGQMLGIQGTWATTYVNTTTSNSASEKCSDDNLTAATMWGNNPPPGSENSVNHSWQYNLCVGPNSSSAGSYYGLLIDQDPGNPVWTATMFQDWPAEAITPMTLPTPPTVVSTNLSSWGWNGSLYNFTIYAVVTGPSTGSASVRCVYSSQSSMANATSEAAQPSSVSGTGQAAVNCPTFNTKSSPVYVQVQLAYADGLAAGPVTPFGN